MSSLALRSGFSSLRAGSALGVVLAAVAVLSSCGKPPPKPPPAPLEVTTMIIEARDTPVSSEYVAQTQSSQGVTIMARVSGYLDKRVYTEGAVVKAGQVLFQLDPKPFQVQVDGAAAALQRNQAALEVATANLKRTKPLAEQNALSQKDLDDAQGQYEQSAAAVAQSKAQLESAKLDLSYTTITSPVAGITSFSAVAEGTYINAQNSQLTTVSVLSPMWVNFSISENEVERIRANVKKGLLRLPSDQQLLVEIELGDGTPYPHTGKITFADPSYNSQTGTFLLRATVDNPRGVLRPNQFLRARVLGAVRPNAILIPQRAVQQGAQGHFVWLINKEGKAEQRPIVVGDWYRDNWFVSEGLRVGDQLVMDGAMRLSQGATVKVMPPAAGAPAAAGSATTAMTAMAATAPPIAAAMRAPLAVYFEAGSARLDATALAGIRAYALAMKGDARSVDIAGYVDRQGARPANVALARQRATAVRDALVAAGVDPARLNLAAPTDVIGSGTDAEARRVEVVARP